MLAAVVYYLIGCFKDVYMIGAESEYCSPLLAGRKGHYGVVKQSLDCVDNAYRVVHHTVWIDNGTELLVNKSSAHVVGET